MDELDASVPIETGEYEAFVIKKRQYYVPRFERFDALAGGFTATWNWWGFGFGPLWLLYRKTYLWAAVAFVLSLIPALALAAHIACGLAGNYLYYRKARATIVALKTAFPGQDIRGKCMDMGGVHGWVTIIVAGLVFLIFAILVASMMAFLFMSKSGGSWV